MSNLANIIGAGVNGLTSAISLQLSGFETTIYAESLVEADAPDNPYFASLYPAASVVPHSINSTQEDTLFPASLKMFATLKALNFRSLTLHRHFELFEHPPTPPSYTRFLHNVSDIMHVDEILPRRDTAVPVYGWVFDCFVAEWPRYMQQLYNIYQQAGGHIVQKRMNREEVAALPGDIIINCSGAGTIDLFDDTAGHAFIRGHLLHVKNKVPVVNTSNQICSYNYTPDTSIYATPQGKYADVYFYPVNGKWILGGSRQPGISQNDGSWKGETHLDTIPINGIDVPRPVIELNNQILKHTFGLKVDTETDDIEIKIGYRYSRKKEADSLRLEKEHILGKDIIHNYGHGGAGVTLSWGCAIKLLHLLGKEPRKREFSSAFLNHLQLQLHKVYYEDFMT